MSGRTASMTGALLLSFGVFASAGHAAEGQSADAIARELANPNNDLAKLTFKNQYRWYAGDLPNADSQSNVTGWSDQSYSTSQLQVFLVRTVGGGWTYRIQPIMNYNWRSEKWTLPIQAFVSKTVKIGDVPVKFDLGVNYYVEQENAFGPKWMVGFNVTPVVSNFFEGM